MKLNEESIYGTYRQSDFVEFFIKFSQSTHNAFGQHIAQIVRKILLLCKVDMIDLEVEGLNFRAYLKGNNSERKFAFMPWRFEKKEREFIESKLSKDSVFLDIGANTGIYTLIAARKIKNGRIISFEPNPLVFKRLKFNLGCQVPGNISQNVEALNIGLSSKNELIPLFLNAGNLGESSLLTSGNGNQSSIDIQCFTLNSICKEKNISKIDALKIDVEGAEDLILIHFFDNSPKSLHPRYIVIERSSNRWKVDLIQLLFDIGYREVFQTKMNHVLELHNN